jgi:hypothetical protein
MRAALSPIVMMVAALTAVACDTTPTAPTALDSGETVSSSVSTHASPADAATKTYRVTIENLTSGQPFSPGVAVTHTQQFSLFNVGSLASEGIRAIAEDGDPSVALAALSGQLGVGQVVELSSPIHRIGGPGSTSLSIDITATANANRLSLAVMLICTNDGFTGAEGIKLPGGFSAVTHTTAGYDAGTEANNEQFTQIVDPCQAIGPVPGPPPIPNGNGRVATSDVIRHHPGIQGGADLFIAAHGWRDPIARITIRRTK